ncbi:hypothetical protein B0H17DRAFT_1336101 [Mycena rosella]|uniref:SIN1-type PH domain-containing protein n=1 Tax=Mycena rosella TaxID=1033263 RepID=A0AAD7CWN9_MYCRO|nr:hypothetical protein B0H17DRAFT_1336101 [Mycena rosella]
MCVLVSFLFPRYGSFISCSNTYLDPQILPTANKATKTAFDSGKHVSYHIQSIADCQQTTKSSAIFKLKLGRTGGKKRYDYKAESAKHVRNSVSCLHHITALLYPTPSLAPRMNHGKAHSHLTLFPLRVLPSLPSSSTSPSSTSSTSC